MTPEERAAKLQRRLDALIEAERATLARCELSGLVDGFEWPAGPRQQLRHPRAYMHRVPPLPFHALVHKGPGSCRVCGQPIWRDDKGTVPDKRTWHPDCLSAFFLWTKAGDYADLLIHRQGGACPTTAEPISVLGCEVDHEVPLFRVALDHAGEPWWRLLRFWGLSNLRALSRAGHVAKSAEEARWRAGHRSRALGRQGALDLA